MQKTSQNPIFSLADGSVRGVLAMVVRTQGPSYRSVGATMVFADDGARLGSLSSGCIESDLALHAQTVRETGAPMLVTYGEGSEFIDIVLPCGGGLDILLIAQPTAPECAMIAQVTKRRKAVTIGISKVTGAITAPQPDDANIFNLSLVPPLQFCVFGKGPEAVHFASLAHALGYGGTVLSPDPETIEAARNGSWTETLLVSQNCPADLSIDAYTAIVLFFHDHDWEAPLLRDLLASNAFYIGAQGSKRAGETRTRELRSLGVSDVQCQRVFGPIGMIPSTRDPQTLAVSVMAEILNKAQAIESHTT